MILEKLNRMIEFSDLYCVTKKKTNIWTSVYCGIKSRMIEFYQLETTYYD